MDLLGCSGSVAAAGSPPTLLRFTASTGSQLAFSSSPLMSLAEPRQDIPGDWSVTGSGGGERGRTSLMRSVIHRHPGEHTLEWGNTTHVLTGLAHNSLGFPRLQGAP